jgi:Ni,Fe-hydrogenase III large subunit/Ni,Fe-hydrogenase III component G
MDITRHTDSSTRRREVPADIATWAPGAVTVDYDNLPVTGIECAPEDLQDVCRRLSADLGYLFATLVVEEAEGRWQLGYFFCKDVQGGLVRVGVDASGAQPRVPSISALVHAADWHERETEDLFGLTFEGHPRLGDFVLHEHRPEGINPMRSDFDAAGSGTHEEVSPWRPHRIVRAPGAFVMPVGPVYSDFSESAHFLLETVGEDVIRVIPRFFYKYRGVEKTAQGRAVEDALLLAERFSGTSAFAHSLAFCQAVEAIGETAPPPRARALRVFLAELERCRHHVGVITEICGSTGLAVATSQAAILEEELLRLCGQYTGHRYLFGLNLPGGLSLDMDDEACRRLGEAVGRVIDRLGKLQHMLRFSSSFLDRIEEVGAITKQKTTDYGLVGPIARASGVGRDLRRDLPYADYGRDTVSFQVPCETEGDGYARLRIFLAEARQSAGILKQIAGALPPGDVRLPHLPLRRGAALGWSEAPRGAAFHWVRTAEDGRVARYRITSPSFTNWHGFHLAAENFAFQDFPIIMATFGLSNAECDR